MYLGFQIRGYKRPPGLHNHANRVVVNLQRHWWPLNFAV
jgi:hypothetical protein